ncbi:MAG: P-loop NTPase fold protein [Cyclobacteriaceae bacterium]
MNDLPINFEEKKTIWVAGTKWQGKENLPEFEQRGLWENYGPLLDTQTTINKAERGDLIIAYEKLQNYRGAIKGIGEVVQNNLNGQSLEVEWYHLFKDPLTDKFAYPDTFSKLRPKDRDLLINPLKQAWQDELNPPAKENIRLQHALSHYPNDKGLKDQGYVMQGLVGYIGNSGLKNTKELIHRELYPEGDHFYYFDERLENLNPKSRRSSSPIRMGYLLTEEVKESTRFYRYYNQINGDHFYGTHLNKEILKFQGYTEESKNGFEEAFLFINHEEGTTPLYVYSKAPEIYLFTPLDEKEQAIEGSEKATADNLKSGSNILHEAFKKHQRVIREVLKKSEYQRIRTNREYYFDKAEKKYYEFRNLQLSPSKTYPFGEKTPPEQLNVFDFAQAKLKEHYAQSNGVDRNFGEFLDNLPKSEYKNLLILAGQLLAYIDYRAYNKSVWNEYEDQRTLAKTSVRQNHAISNLVLYRQTRNIESLPSTSIKNALRHLQDPSRLTILSEKHRAKVSRHLLNVPYSQDYFEDNVNTFFDILDISLENKLNYSVLICRVLYDDQIRSVWDIDTPEIDLADDDSPKVTASDTIKTEYYSDNDYLTDAIAKKDRLNRDNLMSIVADGIDENWEEMDLEENLTILINGPWGSGKSSMLHYLNNHLTERHGWSVVKYNAWENQHSEIPWWILINKVSKEIPRSFVKDGITDLSRSHTFWRASLEYSVTYIGAFITSVLLLFGFSNDLLGENEDITFYASILALIGSLWVAVNGALHNIFKKKSFSALQAKNANDPYDPIKERFKQVVQHKKVAIFIDDLDRCEVDATITLLEGVQTLFKESKVLFVVAGDGHWVSTCFDKKYKDFDGLVKSGQTIGNQFLQKTFQMIVDVPKLSKQQQEKLLKIYLNKDSKEPVESVPSSEEQPTKEEIASLTTLDAVAAVAGSTSASPETRKASAERAAEIIEIEKKHYIEKLFDDGQLPENPRQIIRLINLFTSKVQELTNSGVLSEVGGENTLKYILFSTTYPEYNHLIQSGKFAAEDLNNIDKVKDEEKEKKELLINISAALNGLKPELIQEYL